MDNMRWRYGETEPVMAAVEAETVIEIGDLLLLDGGVARPVAEKTGTPSAASFLGVAMQRSPAGETKPVRVATAGVFEFDCDPGVFELGDSIGLASANQSVAGTTDGNREIGRVARREPDAVRSVLVKMFSRVMGR